MSNLTQSTANATITEWEFNQYTSAWMTALEDPTDTEHERLQSYFTSNKNRIDRFYFKVQDIIHVLSTLRLHTIMVRFGITAQPGATEPPLFTPILVGYDPSGLRVTPYYCGKPQIQDGCSIPGQMQTPSLFTDYSSDQVPDILADAWIQNWGSVEIDPSLFQTSFGYLRGYTFLMQDFLDTLFPLNSNSAKGTYVVVHLAAHEYYDSDNQPKSTFGLVLSAQLSADNSSTNTIARQFYYDLSAPCPPTCRITQLQ